MSDDQSPAGSRGSGPMLAMLIGFVVICAGSVGGVGYVVWRVVRSAADRAADAEIVAEEARREAEEHEGAAIRQRFQTVARAVAQGLNDPDRLADSYTAEGKPLLSWRVHLLPRLGEQALYRRFNLKEPWDGPTNRALIRLMPSVYDYHGPRQEWAPGSTFIRGFSHEGAIFEPGARYSVKDLPGGGDQVLAIFDDNAPVEWTRPDERVWRADFPIPRLGGSFGTLEVRQNQFLAATAAGRVVMVDQQTEPKVVRARFDRRPGARKNP